MHKKYLSGHSQSKISELVLQVTNYSETQLLLAHCISRHIRIC